MSPEEYGLTEESRLTREKKELRRELVTRRDSIPRELRRTHSMMACQHTLTLIDNLKKERSGSFVVTLFLSFGSEIDTRPIISGLFDQKNQNIHLLLPSIRQSKNIILRPWKKGDPLVPSPFGILEPESDLSVSPEEVDLFILPGVGFDHFGHRLGYGKGYYDRLLARKNLRGVRVGLAFSEQVVDRIPVGSFDIPVNFIVTEKGWKSCG